MSTRPWQIYTLADPRTMEVRYIGVTFRGKRRLNEHLSRAVTGGQTHRDCWIRSLIGVGLRPTFAVIQDGSGDGWQEAERQQIARYRRTGVLVNLTDGGDGFPGYIPTPELRAKWSAMRRGVPYAAGRTRPMLGKQHTPDVIEKIRQTSTGRVMPASQRAKLSALRAGKPLPTKVVEASAAARRGKPLRAEHRAKIAAKTTNRKPVVCVETGQTFASVTAAARHLDVNEASVYQAIHKGCRCRGLHWRAL